eukprot:scaffold152382_cov29-Tisochrysis_lutea.AAC.2
MVSGASRGEMLMYYSQLLAITLAGNIAVAESPGRVLHELGGIATIRRAHAHPGKLRVDILPHGRVVLATQDVLLEVSWQPSAWAKGACEAFTTP